MAKKSSQWNDELNNMKETKNVFKFIKKKKKKKKIKKKILSLYLMEQLSKPYIYASGLFNYNWD